jgi:predicted phosphodiesterase
MRALILSDIHANLEALESVLAAAAGQYDQLWNLGDIVGYGASPNEVIERIRPISTLVVRGNHDRVSCGLTSPHSFNPVARTAILWTRDQLTAENLAWLREVPKGPLQPEFPEADAGMAQTVTCAHGSPLDEDHYIINMRDAWAPLQKMQTPLTFFGHTHVQGGFSQREHDWHELRPQYPAGQPGAQPARDSAQSFTLTLDQATRHLVNPGSVGQPRDHDWRASYALYTSPAAPGEPAQVAFHRVPYDLLASQGRILMAGLPERLAARLREGR